MTFLETFYNKFNEDKRLLTPYGRVEYEVTFGKILEELQKISRKRDRVSGENSNVLEEAYDVLQESPGIHQEAPLKILDLGCGTGIYALPLAKLGYAVTALDPVQHHVGLLKQKAEREGLFLTCRKGNALKLSKEGDASYDLVLLLGPFYHLFTEEDKTQALLEARRVLKPSGRIFAGFLNNDYAVIQYGLVEGHLEESLQKGKLTPESFLVRNTEEDIFSFDTFREADRLEAAAGLKRFQRFTQDGPANYFRQEISRLSTEGFQAYLSFVQERCKEPEFLGTGEHFTDILGL